MHSATLLSTQAVYLLVLSAESMLYAQVYMHKGRMLLGMQAVKQALKVAGPAHPDVHRLVVRLCHTIQQQQQQQQENLQPNGTQVTAVACHTCFGMLCLQLGITTHKHSMRV